MKFLLVLIGLIGFSSAAIKDDLEAFRDLIPFDKISEIVRNHLRNDPQFQGIVKYLQSPRWNMLKSLIVSRPGTETIVAYMLGAGMDIISDIVYVQGIINKMSVGKQPPERPTNVTNFIEEVISVMPEEKLDDLFDAKYESSPQFRQFLTLAMSKKVHQLVNEIRSIPESQRLQSRLKTWGYDVNKVFNTIYHILKSTIDNV